MLYHCGAGNLSASELKKLKNKQRKAQKKAAEEKAAADEAAKKQAATDKSSKSNQSDADGDPSKKVGVVFCIHNAGGISCTVLIHTIIASLFTLLHGAETAKS